MGDKDDCGVGALAAGVEILLDVGTRQREGEVGEAAGSGVRAIWGKEERKRKESLFLKVSCTGHRAGPSA